MKPGLEYRSSETGSEQKQCGFFFSNMTLLIRLIIIRSWTGLLCLEEKERNNFGFCFRKFANNYVRGSMALYLETQSVGPSIAVYMLCDRGKGISLSFFN